MIRKSRPNSAVAWFPSLVPPSFIASSGSITPAWFRTVALALQFLLAPVLPSVQAEDSVSSLPHTATGGGHAVNSWLDAQVELHRRGFSCGSIDGIYGPLTRAALSAFQRSHDLPETGVLDAATRHQLALTAPVLTEHTFTNGDLNDLRPLPDTWLGKSEQANLAYSSALEMVAERYHTSPSFLRRINPDTDWETLVPGTTVRVPAAERAIVTGFPAHLVIRLASNELEAVDAQGRVIAHCPVSIAREIDQRPIGNLHVTVVIPEPNYTFDPTVFPESAEGAELGRRLVLPPGPNNPVGRAWIGLDRPGYGIHGTPNPENISRTESHGCFRVANWDALTLLLLVRVGMTVVVEP